MNFGGIRFSKTEIESVTISRDGTTITINKSTAVKSPKVEGFGRNVRPPKPEPPQIELRREC